LANAPEQSRCRPQGAAFAAAARGIAVSED